MLDLHGLLGLLQATGPFQNLHHHLQAGQATEDQNLLRAAQAYAVAALADQLARPILLITSHSDRAYNLAEQLPVWLPGRPVMRFPEPKAAFYERSPWSEDTIRARLEVLALLFHWQADTPPPIVVTAAPALMVKTLPIRDFRLGSKILSRQQNITGGQAGLVEVCKHLGYEAVNMVTAAGQFSRRGGIMDIYPLNQDKPLRVEFFGDEVESLRRFDPASQRSLEQIERLVLAPVREALPKQGPRALAHLADWFAQQNPEAPFNTLADQEALAASQAFPFLEFYLPLLYEQTASLLDYLPQNTLVVVDDWGQLQDSIADLEEAALIRREDLLRQGALPPQFPTPYHTWDALYDDLLTRQPLHLGRQPEQHPEGVLGDLFTSEMRFGGQVRTVLEHLHGLRGAGEKTLTITRQADHLAKLWSDTHSPLQTLAGINDLADLGLTNFIPGELGEGWRLNTGGGVWHLFTDAEIFGWQRPEPRRHSRPKQSTPEAPFADLQVGDYVVHIEHGIGRFEGLIKQVFKGEERELLKLEYAGNDVLFVPIHQADRVTRYIAPGDAGPTLNRLGTQEWVKIRQKATEAAEKFAEELLKLYAAREVATGHAFGPDTPWQHELEAAFPYVETDDQLSAIRAVKADMESPQPMDRLVCGDVGYGKTEVAMRAAFKAVMDKKQVALLAPTTILANQHYHNFRERMAHFGVNVEMLSRFRNEKQQDQILAALAAGQIDIIIGTHRLLGSDVQFKDLGLVIVDEEQRFGMTHKEQLKLFRNELDVLTLTATPIPRTLYTTIVGIRDISTISTAPDERLPVATHVGVYNGALVRQAIVRELERGGQVFFVHNRVQTIDSIAGHLREMLPQAQIAVGHGQMSEQQLEKVMLQFALGEADILLATSIIENGLDIPNANTIIIDRADWFGLAALYQLRGRVGRSARQAYAYFFHPPYSKITDEARQRLEILSQENQLGVGLSIAMRDLEMRGAGDLLGKRQSGHVAAVGFHLYTQLLAQAVRRLRPKHTSSVGPAPIQPALIIDLPIPAYIPREYIPDAALRIQLYRRLADLHELGAVDDMQAELEDRFGKLPRAIEGLLYQLKVKVLAAQAQATAILQDTERIGIKLPYLALIDRHDLQKLLGEAVKVSREAIWLPRSPQESQWQPLLLGVLEKLHVAPYWVKEREPSELSS